MPSNQDKLSISPIAIEVAECFAVIYPDRPARSKVMKWAGHARKQMGASRGFKHEEFKNAIDELVSVGVLHPSIEGRKGVAAQGPMVSMGFITEFCESAVKRGTANIILREIEAELNRYSFSSTRDEFYLEQRMRIALLENNFNAFAHLQLPAHIWLWLTEPQAIKYFKRLPEPHFMAACQFGLQWLIEYLQPIDVFSKTIASISNNPTMHVLLCRSTILQGNFKQAEKYRKKAMAAAEPENKFMKIELQALQALTFTLKGDDESALKSIEETLSIERSGTRKKIVYPDSFSFTLALFSLIRLGTPNSRELFNSLIYARNKLKIHSDLDVLLMAAERAELPQPDLGPLYLGGPPSLMGALFAIGSCWHESYRLSSENQGYQRLLEDLIRQAHGAGYTWVVAELVGVLEISFDKNTQLSDDVKTLLLEANAESRHTSLGTKTLSKLVEAMEPWEYAIRELEQLGLKAKKVKVQKKNTANESSRRVVWQVSPSYAGSVNVTPIEQSLDKKGQWTTGRRMSLKRLREQSDSMPYLISQDVAASGTIQKYAAYGWGGGNPSYETTERTVFQLIDHPFVFDENGLQYEVIERPAELRLHEQEDVVKLCFEPEFLGAAYRSDMDTNKQRIYVTHFSAAQQRIQAVIPSLGLNVPIAASERLEKLALALTGDISVVGSTNTASEELLQAVAQPILYLEPYGASLRVRIRVEPLPDSNVLFDAGSGGSVVHINTNNSTVSLRRDLQKEQAMMLDLINQSIVLSEHYNGLPYFVLNDTTASLELLSELQQLNIRCVWPGDIPFRIKAQADVTQVQLNITSAKNWLEADGSVLLDEKGEQSLELARLLELMQSRPDSRFVPLGKDEFLALSKTLHQQLKTLQAFRMPASKAKNEQQLHPMAVVALEPLLEQAKVTGDSGWKKTRKHIVTSLTCDIPIPSTLQTELRDYQTAGFVWLARLGAIGAGACLADDMGLGKTIQSLALLLHRAANGPALVVAPTSVTGNWLQEAQQFAPSLKIISLNLSTEERQLALQKLSAFDVVVVSYGLLLSSIELLEKINWHTVVLDEAQAIKNAHTGRAKAAKRLKADFRITTTGTPVQNNLMDLHSLFGFLNPQLLGSESVFRQRFAIPISRDQDKHAREELQAIVSPFLLRRQKREVLRELPSRSESTLHVKLSPEESALYESIRLEALASLETKAESDSASRDVKKQSMLILSYLTKLRRLCCNPSLVSPDWNGPTSKLELLTELLNNLLESGHKALVFSQFVDHLQLVKKELDKQGVSYQYLDGKTPTKKRNERVTQFQSGQGDVFLISLTAGGTGLNLTAADHVIHLDPWWNPAVEDQASDRAHRLGQQRPVTIVRMVTSGTIEEQIQKLHNSKRELADSILAGSDTSSLDAKRLLALLHVGISDLERNYNV